MFRKQSSRWLKYTQWCNTKMLLLTKLSPYHMPMSLIQILHQQIHVCAVYMCHDNCIFAMGRDGFMNVPSQWEMTLHCNVIFHWLGTFMKWYLNEVDVWYHELCLVVMHCWDCCKAHKYKGFWSRYHLMWIKRTNINGYCWWCLLDCLLK